MQKLVQTIVALAALPWLIPPAAGQEIPPPAPFLMPPSPAQSADSSLWKGLYVGNEVFAVSGKGGKGGFGGGGFLGYERALAPDVVLGVQGNVGYAPGWFRQGGVRGFDYAGGVAKLGYEMGRFTTYVTAGANFAKPDVVGRGFTTSNDSVNDLVNARSSVKASGTVGVGVDYAITDRLKVGVSVEGRAGKGPWTP